MSYRVCGKDIKKTQISLFPLLISVLSNGHNAFFLLTGISASVYWHLFSNTWANWGCMERKIQSASFEIIPSLPILLPQRPFTDFFLIEIFLCNMWYRIYALFPSYLVFILYFLDLYFAPCSLPSLSSPAPMLFSIACCKSREQK